MPELRVVESGICRGGGGFGRWVERFVCFGMLRGGERFFEVGSSGFWSEFEWFFWGWVRRVFCAVGAEGFG